MCDEKESAMINDIQRDKKKNCCREADLDEKITTSDKLILCNVHLFICAIELSGLPHYEIVEKSRPSPISFIVL